MAQKLWVDKYCPTGPDLCIHATKRKEVENAIKAACEKQLKILVLVGPTGSGKTAAVNTICREKKIEIVQYSNPVKIKYLDGENKDRIDSNLEERVLSHFFDFLKRTKYPTIEFGGTKDKLGKICLIEDMPNLHGPEQKKNFQEMVNSILNSNQATPIVFIISDTTTDSMTSITLFDNSFFENKQVCPIRFNPVNETSMRKVLENIKIKENLDIDDGAMSQIVLSSGGDIRNAINTLQFYVDPSKEQPKKAKKGKEKEIKGVKGGKGTKQKKKKIDEQINLEEEVKDHSISYGRDFSLSLFHALGKILYNKRRIVTEYYECEMNHNFREIPANNPIEIRESVQHIDAPVFNRFLAENYLQFYSSIEDAAMASGYLSDSVYLKSKSSWDHRLDEAAWIISCLGVMFSNTNTVSMPNRALIPLRKPHFETIHRIAKRNQEILENLMSENSSILPYIEDKDCFNLDVLPYVNKICFSPMKSNQLSSQFSNSQKSFINSLTNYSTNGEESLATRGSAVLGEFDNYFKNNLSVGNNHFKSNTNMSNALTLNGKPKVPIGNMEIDDDIEEIDFF